MKPKYSTLVFLALALSLAFNTFADHLHQPSHYLSMERSIQCPGNATRVPWCYNLKEQLQDESLTPDSERYKRLLGRLMVAASFSAVAQARNEILVHRPVEPAAYAYLTDGHPTKGIHVKGKTADWGPHRGLIPVLQKYSKIASVSVPEKRESLIKWFDKKNCESIEKGKAFPLWFRLNNTYAVLRDSRIQWTEVLEEGDQPLELMANPYRHRYLTADIDFLAFGIFATEGPIFHDNEFGVVTERELETIMALNTECAKNGYSGGRIVQHGAEDRFDHSEGVDYPVTIFEPDGTMMVIEEDCGIIKDQFLRRYFQTKSLEGYTLEVNPSWDWNNTTEDCATIY